MFGRNRLTVTAVVAILVPMAIFVAGTVGSYPFTLSDLFAFIPILAIFITPQMLVLIAARLSPRLRRRFAPLSLVALTILFVLVMGFCWLSRDPQSFMLSVVYFPLSVFVVSGIFLFTPREGNSAGRRRPS